MPHDMPPPSRPVSTEMVDAFVAGLRAAPNKLAFLNLAGVPLEPDRGQLAGFKLLQVRIGEAFNIGAAAPGFGRSELAYQPLPETKARTETAVTLIYVSLTERRDVPLETMLGD